MMLPVGTHVLLTDTVENLELLSLIGEEVAIVKGHSGDEYLIAPLSFSSYSLLATAADIVPLQPSLTNDFCDS